MAKIANFLSRQKKRIIAVSADSVSTQFLQPITSRIGDYSYMYIQYGISITLDYTITLLWATFSFGPQLHWDRSGVQTLLNK